MKFHLKMFDLNYTFRDKYLNARRNREDIRTNGHLKNQALLNERIKQDT